MARLWNNKKLRYLCIILGLTSSLLVGVFINNMLNDKVINDDKASDLSAMSGMKSDTLYKLYEAVGDWNTLRDNIFIYKYIMDEHINIANDNKGVYEIIKKYKPEELLAIYEYSSRKDLKLQDLESMLQLIDSGVALETTLVEMEVQKEYKIYIPATKEQIKNWLSLGYDPNDIIEADTIAKGVDILLQDVFALKTQDNTWTDVGTLVDYKLEEPLATKVELKVKNGQEVQVLSNEDYESIAEEASNTARNSEDKLYSDLKKESLDIDKYIAMGFNVKEVNNAVMLSKESGILVDEILEYKGSGQTWENVIKKYSIAKGEINR